jgi:cellulose synthase (UDP-forming)
LRVQVIYSFAHLLCVLDLLRRHAEEWVPSGDQTQTTPVGRRVRRFMVPFIVLSQAGIVVGLAHGVWRYGIGAFWAAILFGAFGLYISVPIVIESVRRRRPESAGVPEAGDPRAAVRAYADPV